MAQGVCCCGSFFCVDFEWMGRRGWQHVDVPSGWIQVIRGPRPNSVVWPRPAHRVFARSRHKGQRSRSSFVSLRRSLLRKRRLEDLQCENERLQTPSEQSEPVAGGHQQFGRRRRRFFFLRNEGTVSKSNCCVTRYARGSSAKKEVSEERRHSTRVTHGFTLCHWIHQ